MLDAVGYVKIWYTVKYHTHDNRCILVYVSQSWCSVFLKNVEDGHGKHGKPREADILLIGSHPVVHVITHGFSAVEAFQTCEPQPLCARAHCQAIFLGNPQIGR